MNIFNLTPSIYFAECEDDLDFIKSSLGVNPIVGNNYNGKISKIYIVKPLDTISSVSKKLGITESELYNLTKTKYLFVGQKINLK